MFYVLHSTFRIYSILIPLFFCSIGLSNAVYLYTVHKKLYFVCKQLTSEAYETEKTSDAP